MRILIIASEEWNDYVFANGVLTNWFTDMDAEFAEIYTSPGTPINDICERYFQITDSQMAKSIVGGPKAGRRIYKATKPAEIENAKQNAQRQGVYRLMKNLSMSFHTPVLILRDFIWMLGRYNKRAIQEFIDEFNPDVVFCPRYISLKLMRLEKLVSTMTNAPFVAFTGDDEASLGRFRPTLSWLRRWLIHRMFKKHIQLYSHYLMHSSDQAKEYHDAYGIETSTIFKCGEFPDCTIQKRVGAPIRLVYAGRLYCNRWKSLAAIGRALQIINKESVKMVLDIYTQEELSDVQRKALSEDRFIYMKGCVTPTELRRVYERADVALHVESLDEHYRMVTRVSFSTKIIDLMASTCAILAICWEKHCGYQYLKANNAAFCCSEYDSILPQLKAICDNPLLITEYRSNAYNCGRRNHSRVRIQKQLLDVFDEAIRKRAMEVNPRL